LPDKEPDQNDQGRKRVQNYMKYSGMAMQMGIIILLGVFAGQKLDEYFQTSPFLTVTLALLSIFAALYSTLKDLL
jgi:F0F1-type ATP synthase assembly protein I